MKRVAYLVSVTLLFFTACGDKTESKRQGTGLRGSIAVAAAADADKAQDAEKQQETQRKLEDRLDELNNEIKDLKLKAAKASEKAKAELHEMMKELDKKMAAAKQQLERLKTASARTWEEAKSRTRAALDDLQKTYDRAVERIKKSA